jgi:hypothetical protein
MFTETCLTFFLVSYWTNDYFSLPDGKSIDFNHIIIKVYTLNDENYFEPHSRLINLMFIHSGIWVVIVRMDLSVMMTDKEANSITECPTDSMKASEIASSQKSIHFWFSSNCEGSVLIKFKSCC